MNVLVVGPPQRAQGLAFQLGLEGHRVSAADPSLAVLSLNEGSAGVVLLDHCTDDELEKLVTEIQQRVPNPDLIILPKTYSEDAMVHYLSLGVTDYLPRQLTPRALSARLAALERRRLDTHLDVLRVGGFQLDPVDRVVRRDGHEVPLTPTEFRLLEALLKRRGRTCDHKTLLKEVWGGDSVDREEYLRVYVSLLRQKLEQDPRNPKLLITVRGIGYRFIDGAEKPNPTFVATRRPAQTSSA